MELESWREEGRVEEGSGHGRERERERGEEGGGEKKGEDVKGIVGIVGTGDTLPLCICLFYFVCESLLQLRGLLLGCLLVRLCKAAIGRKT